MIENKKVVAVSRFGTIKIQNNENWFHGIDKEITSYILKEVKKGAYVNLELNDEGKIVKIVKVREPDPMPFKSEAYIIRQNAGSQAAKLLEIFQKQGVLDDMKGPQIREVFYALAEEFEQWVLKAQKR